MHTPDMINLAAVLLQFAVAGYALRMTRVLGLKRVGWSLFAAFSLLALLHLVQSAVFFYAEEQSTISIEMVYALISLLLLIGMAHVEHLFKERARFEQEELRLRAELELEVEKKTNYLTRAIEALQTEVDERKRMETELQAHIELLNTSRRELLNTPRHSGWLGFKFDEEEA